MRLVIISDTHSRTPLEVPDGDVLVHCGDFTMKGTVKEITRFDDWLRAAPHKYKIVVAGNHDLAFEDAPTLAQRLLTTSIYLQDASVEVEGIRFWGAPWTPWFFDWAFNLPRGRALAAKWALIPEKVDVVITHGPPHGILDANPEGEHVGDEALRKAIERVKPRVHAFGHIHHSHGTRKIGQTLFVNASICDESYSLAESPIVVDLNASGVRLAK
jgi:Icc-related predicted phosphoesterase